MEDSQDFAFHAREQQLIKRNAELEAKKTAVLRHVASRPPFSEPESIEPSNQETKRAPTARQYPSSTPPLSHESSSSRGANREEWDDVDAFEADLNPTPVSNNDSKVRLLHARIKALEDTLTKLQTDSSKKESIVSDQDKLLKQSESERRKLTRKIGALETQLAQQKTIADETGPLLKEQENQIESLRAQVLALEKEKKKVEQDSRNRDVKLNRALQEVQKYKEQVAQALSRDSSSTATSAVMSNESVAQLTAQIRKLTQQKEELLAAFKKQMKLIDVLKRQKIHMEAAKLLSFTEEEFVKSLDLGDRF